MRGQLISYINLYHFLNDPEKTRRVKNKAYKKVMQFSLFLTYGTSLQKFKIPYLIFKQIRDYFLSDKNNLQQIN